MSEALGNYLPADTTSEGGYGGAGAHVFEPDAQRGLIDQITNGQPLGNEIQDAYQGKDAVADKKYKEDMKRNGKNLSPYNNESYENRRDAENDLASSITDNRARKSVEEQ